MPPARPSTVLLGLTPAPACERPGARADEERRRRRRRRCAMIAASSMPDCRSGTAGSARRTSRARRRRRRRAAVTREVRAPAGRRCRAEEVPEQRRTRRSGTSTSGIGALAPPVGAPAGRPTHGRRGRASVAGLVAGLPQRVEELGARRAAEDQRRRGTIAVRRADREEHERHDGERRHPTPIADRQVAVAARRCRPGRPLAGRRRREGVLAPRWLDRAAAAAARRRPARRRGVRGARCGSASPPARIGRRGSSSSSSNTNVGSAAGRVVGVGSAPIRARRGSPKLGGQLVPGGRPSARSCGGAATSRRRRRESTTGCRGPSSGLARCSVSVEGQPGRSRRSPARSSRGSGSSTGRSSPPMPARSCRRRSSVTDEPHVLVGGSASSCLGHRLTGRHGPAS